MLIDEVESLTAARKAGAVSPPLLCPSAPTPYPLLPDSLFLVPASLLYSSPPPSIPPYSLPMCECVCLSVLVFVLFTPHHLRFYFQGRDNVSCAGRYLWSIELIPTKPVAIPVVNYTKPNEPY